MIIKDITDKKAKRISLPKDALLEALPTCSETEIKVLVSVLATPDFSESDLCEKLDITKKSLKSAVNYWCEKGVIENLTDKVAQRTVNKKDNKKTEEKSNVQHRALMRASTLPTYTSDELSALVDENPQMGELIFACQQSIGKMFSTPEIEIVVGLSDYLKLDNDYIMLLFSHCAKMNKKSLRYVERLAVDFFDRGILDYDELDEHLNAIEEAYKADGKLRKLFGIGRRTLSEKEKRFFEDWVGRWKMPMAVIEKAYEITIENTGNASVSYCNAILSSWHNEGVSDLEAAEKAAAAYKHDKTGVKDKGSFETDDFFDAALSNMMKDT